jgi:hypothetical protein
LVGKLRKSHESAPRIFQFLSLAPLLPEDRVSVIDRGLEEAAKKNDLEVKATEGARRLISTLSEGYPHFIQQFAYSAFEEDTDSLIDEVDVTNGAFKRDGGAFQQLGEKYFEGLYFDQIWSDEYREVLRVMAAQTEDWVDRGTILKQANIKQSTLNNALAALKKKNIVVTKRGKKGVYRLPTRSFAVWIRAFTQASAEKEKESEATNHDVAGNKK